jgi:hypothetical protein
MGMRRTSFAHIIGSPASQKVSGSRIRPSSKYGNRRTEVDGIVFDSQHEANFYSSVIVPGVRSGEIVEWTRQHRFVLVDDPDRRWRIEYVADFVIRWKDGKTEIIDAKGFRTDVYRIKKILMRKLLGHEIREV